MGYLFLGIALLAGATKGFCGKKTSNFVQDFYGASFANMIRMLMCIGIGFIIIVIGGDISYLKLSLSSLLIALLSGVGTAMFVVTWLLSVKKGAYMLVEVFLMLGVFIPMIGSLCFFEEKILINQWIGFIVLIIAVLFMISYNNSTVKKISASAYVTLFLCGLANGITNFSQKIFVKLEEGVPNSVFNFYTYVFASIVIFLFYVFSKPKDQKNSVGYKYIFIFIPIMAVCLFANSYFKTEAARYLSATQLYPLNQGLALVLSTIMATVFWKEKLKFKSVIGIFLSFVGLLIINML